MGSTTTRPLTGWPFFFQKIFIVVGIASWRTCCSLKIEFAHMKTASPRSQSAPVVPRTPQPPGPFFWGALCVGRRFSLKVAQIARVGRSMHPMGHLGRCGRRGAAAGHQKGPPTTTGASRASAELGHENPPPPPPNGQGVLPRDHWACWTGWVAAQQRKMTRPGARLATRGISGDFFSRRQKSLPEAFFWPA